MAAFFVLSIFINILNYERMKKKLIRLTESDLHKMIEESVKRILISEISAQKAQDAAAKALKIGREGFDIYNNEIPNDSYHGKKFLQGQKFLGYMYDKLGVTGKEGGLHIYYPNGDGSVMVLRDDDGNVLTKPCHSIEELEAEYKKLKR